VYYPGSTNYTLREASYWCVDARLSPSCIVQPRNTAEVAEVLTILANANGNFAVRSGGHSQWAGGSDIHVGATIDLGLFTNVTYNPATQLASIQPGPNWGQVYTALAAEGICVTGGRDAGVGIGGFLTGGGNSYYVGKTGFAIDTIINMEVVLSNGSIVNANATSNADLWKALKGGSGNFGIVTRFDVEAFPNKDVWGGARIANKTYQDEFVTALIDFTNNNVNNPQDALILAFSYNPAQFSEVVIFNVIVDTDGVVNAPAFNEVYSIPTISTDISTRSMTNIAVTYEQVAGNRYVKHITFFFQQLTSSRNTWFSLTFTNSAAIVQFAIELHDLLVAELQNLLPAGSFSTECLFQPIPTYFSQISVQKGGNVLGLDSETQNALLWLLTGTFQTAAHEATARPLMLAYNALLEDYATFVGGNVAWRYINYVDSTQDPLASYGAANIALMKSVSAKYDPAQVFQTKSPSGFKLSAM
jgi:hypothetical protein